MTEFDIRHLKILSWLHASARVETAKELASMIYSFMVLILKMGIYQSVWVGRTIDGGSWNGSMKFIRFKF